MTQTNDPELVAKEKGDYCVDDRHKSWHCHRKQMKVHKMYVRTASHGGSHLPKDD